MNIIELAQNGKNEINLKSITNNTDTDDFGLFAFRNEYYLFLINSYQNSLFSFNHTTQTIKIIIDDKTELNTIIKDIYTKTKVYFIHNKVNIKI